LRIEIFIFLFFFEPEIFIFHSCACSRVSLSLYLGVQTDYDVVHLRTSLVQLFVLLQLNFEEVVQIIELSRFVGAPNGYPFAALGHRPKGGLLLHSGMLL
jgi:hypothetical protein